MSSTSAILLGTVQTLAPSDHTFRLLVGHGIITVHLSEPWHHQLDLLINDIPVAILRPVWVNSSSVIVGEDSLLVIEPSSLYDVTDVVSTIDESGYSAVAALIRRLLPPVFSPAAAKGTLVNTVLDLRVTNPRISADEIMQRAERHHAVLMAHLHRRGELGGILDAVRRSIPLIDNGLASFSTGSSSLPTFILEPTFASPMLGLVGRIDVLVQHTDVQQHCDVIELKSGSAPANTARAAHRAQVVAYDMLLEQTMSERSGTSMVWYPLADGNPWRDVQATASDRRSIIMARNALVDVDRRLAMRDPKVLHWLTAHDFNDLPVFMRSPAQNLRADILALSGAERLYVRAWLGFIASEQRQQRNDLGRPMWNDDLTARRLRPSALTDLRRMCDDELEASHLRFERVRQHDDCSLRVGDIVIAYPMQNDRADPSASQILKATIRSITPHMVEISLRNKHLDTAMLAASVPWVVESDASETNLKDLYANVGSYLQADAATRQRLLGTARPRMHPPVPVRVQGLRDTQRAVVERALGAQDWFLIQGPPGTGKTSSVIRALITGLLADGRERILLVAFTNRAADEICQVIERSLGPSTYLRVGAKDTRSSSRSLHTLSASMDAPALCDLLRATRCVVATIAAMTRNMDILEHGAFTTVIVDEASQVLEPQLLGILSAADRFILVGDECQLPAVITQPADRLTTSHETLKELGLSSLGTSYFDRLLHCALRNGWTDVIGRLTEQGRMHDAIGSIAGELFYGNALAPMHPAQAVSDSWLVSADPAMSGLIQARAAVIHVPANNGAAVSEVSVTVALTCRMLETIDASGAEATVGIIAPFRTHINAIRQALPAGMRDRVTVDTVERYQGSERDVIVYAVGVSSASDVEALTSETFTQHGTIDRKLNVAFTRARQQFIMVGDTEVLGLSPHYRALLNRLTPISAASIVC